MLTIFFSSIQPDREQYTVGNVDDAVRETTNVFQNINDSVAACYAIWKSGFFIKVNKKKQVQNKVQNNPDQAIHLPLLKSAMHECIPFFTKLGLKPVAPDTLKDIITDAYYEGRNIFFDYNTYITGSHGIRMEDNKGLANILKNHLIQSNHPLKAFKDNNPRPAGVGIIGYFPEGLLYTTSIKNHESLVTSKQDLDLICRITEYIKTKHDHTKEDSADDDGDVNDGNENDDDWDELVNDQDVHSEFQSSPKSKQKHDQSPKKKQKKNTDKDNTPPTAPPPPAAAGTLQQQPTLSQPTTPQPTLPQLQTPLPSPYDVNH
jgi:hypothetical protein